MNNIAPCVFLSHGGPATLLLDGCERKTKNFWLEQLGPLIKEKSKAAVFISAHWYFPNDDENSVVYANCNKIMHDFGEFFPGIYDISYSVKPLDPAQVESLLRKYFSKSFPKNNRGLDHGAWIPAKLMGLQGFPTFQIAMPHENPVELANFGQKLSKLRDHGLALIFSGGSVHNLPHSFGIFRNFMREGGDIDFFTFEKNAPQTSKWAMEFEEILSEGLNSKDNIKDFWNHIASNEHGLLRRAHPTLDHISPVFAFFGAIRRDTETISKLFDEFSAGDLGMHIYSNSVKLSKNQRLILNVTE